ncbi:hypothetical protein CSUNSWCD_794 [Campylobacter showae CSUNSWCD]|uniref:Uncharacterized protein n=1 Tax=Campylobacter showae CSUNSWCD TaxID=1244083 RepID=M5IQB3_9BACT|nr:hypothetical protein CSUNSWCD_794 [Campylobacter showae CSUNSWCD]
MRPFKFDALQIWLSNLPNLYEPNLPPLAFYLSNLTVFVFFKLNLPQISRIS